jgi:GMP synthase (glutamine-hydrolysing)
VQLAIKSGLGTLTALESRLSPPGAPHPQITVLDTGGQYTHLIARKVRELGVFADVLPSETPAEKLRTRKGVIISGGPASVYEAGCPDIDPALLSTGLPVLGICYGHQLIAHHLGGVVTQGERGEYGVAHVKVTRQDAIFQGVSASQVWMSHRDSVQAAPEGFEVIGSTDTSGVAAMRDGPGRLYGLQFHPEVAHTHAGATILRNFVFGICGAVRDWDVSTRVPLIEAQIRETVGDRNVFFFVSGGVDSTVAYTLCLRALGPERVYGLYVDTGLMRKNETEFVRGAFQSLGATHFEVEHAADAFLAALDGLWEPEAKRLAIGEEFVEVQDRLLKGHHFLSGEWILGQGTIYPDTIESGGTAKADLIKTHHNRVAGIQALIDGNRIIEPLTSFYKDEVREIGKELGVPGEFLARHPFPGPGLAIRCLCAEKEAPVTLTPDGYLLPIRSVGVQGDSRSYRQVLAIDEPVEPMAIRKLAPGLTNRRSDINRVVSVCGTKTHADYWRVRKSTITRARLDLLRDADALVREYCHDSGFEQKVWQFPVVLIPVGTAERPESVVLRPIHSVDGMTAEAVAMPAVDLRYLTMHLLELPGVSAVFYDLTNKPPGTIEWE